MWSKYPEILTELNMVEEYIKKCITSRNKLLTKISSELVGAGGKRLRPAFVILSSKFGNYDSQKVVDLAGALEILHMATLVHDDIIDCAEYRRGKMTVAKCYGADMAVYTGDFLFTKAVLMLSRDVSVEKLDMVANAIKSICEGEVDQYIDRFNLDTSILGYLKRIGRKTAILFGVACGLGAYAGECTSDISRKLTKFGLYYGMAFQIRDDLNDYLATGNQSGKPVGSDLLKGVVTLPAIYALNRSKDVKKVIEGLLDKKEGLDVSDSLELLSVIKENKGIESANRVMDKYINKGLSVLKSLPDNEYTGIFRELINKLKLKE